MHLVSRVERKSWRQKFPEIKLNLRRTHLPRFLLTGLITVLGGIALDASNNSVSAQSDVYPLSVSGYCNNTLGIGGDPFVSPVDNLWHCANGRLVELALICKIQHSFDHHPYNPDPSNPYSWGCTTNPNLYTSQPAPSVVVPEYPISPDNNYPSSNSSQPEANLPSTSSGSVPDFADFCAHLGKGAPYNPPGSRDHYCEGYSLIISPDEVCRYDYPGSHAVNPNVMNANGWSCEGGSAGVANNNVIPNNPPANNIPTNNTTEASNNSTNNSSTNNNPSGNTEVTPGNNTSSGTGGISKEQVSPIQIFTGSSSPPTSGDYLRVTANNLNIRGFPGTDQPILGQVKNGDYYPLIEVRGDWGLITGSYGAGWVYLSYTEVHRQTAVAPAPTEVRPNIEGNTLVSINFEPWGSTYNLSVNPRTCAITNGADIVAQEIGRLNSALATLDFLQQHTYAFNYFRTNNGEIEQLRARIESDIKLFTGCKQTYYLVGNLSMDTSGLGNILYGYFMERYYPTWLTHRSADFFQAFNDETKGWLRDMPDDSTQINTGAIVHQNTGTNGVSGQNIIAAAEASDLY